MQKQERRHSNAPVYMTTKGHLRKRKEMGKKEEVCGMQKQENAVVIKCQSL